jgi:nucleotide-binding universal stress UspA family protein
MRILVPDVDPVNVMPAVRHVAREFLNGERFCVHLLYVRRALDRAAADRALAPARALLEKFHVPCTVHVEAADDVARAIRAVAQRVGVDRIVLGTARSWSLTRLSEDRLIQELLDTAPVPLAVVPGKSVSPLERYGVAAGLGATLALMVSS